MTQKWRVLAVLVLLVGPAWGEDYKTANGGGGGGSATSITIGTTSIVNGTSGRNIYDAAGVVGETSGETCTTTICTLVTPVLGAATGTSLALGGAAIGTNNLAVTGTTLLGGNVSVNVSLPMVIGGGSSPFIQPNGGGFYLMKNGDSIGGSTPLIMGTNAGGLILSSANGGGAVLTLNGTGIVTFGAADALAPVAQTHRVQSAAAGNNNVAGVNNTFVGSLSTGSGVSGDTIFQTGGTGAAATVQNAAVTALTIKGATQQVNFAGQINVAAMTQTSVAQSGTVCYNSGTGAINYDATLGCLTSDERLKDISGPITGALDLVMREKPIVYSWKPEAPKAAIDPGQHLGLGAFATAYVDERLIARDPEGNPRAWREDAEIADLVAAIQEMNSCHVRILGSCWF